MTITRDSKHENISDGIGVCFLTWNKAKNDGKCPSLAPVANNRADVKITPLTPPNVLKATKIGISQLNDPNTLLPNVCGKDEEKRNSFQALNFIDFLHTYDCNSKT